MALVGKEINPSDLLPGWIFPKKASTKAERKKELKDLKKELKIKD